MLIATQGSAEWIRACGKKQQSSYGNMSSGHTSTSSSTKASTLCYHTRLGLAAYLASTVGFLYS